MSEGVSEGVSERCSFNSKLRNEFERMNCKASAPIKAWEMKPEIMTDQETDRPTDGHNKSSCREISLQ